ncbi:MAG: DUF4166 domain-containing protein [Alteraurantiacibacter sp.]
MTRILVLGGYGGFGGRISRRLADENHTVLVAGRSMTKAAAFCGHDERFVPVALDRADIAGRLAEHRPAIVIDASGPFQAMDQTVPRACIAAGAHYCDIADSRDFVCIIGELNSEASAAGVVVLSGASSVPALSGAVVRELTKGMERVAAVEMAISASNRATAGGAVAAAIVGQVGQPFTLRRGSRSVTVYGWQELQQVSFTVPGMAPVEGRTVALVDVPDVSLLPERLPGSPAVEFRAGGELSFQNIALWLLSWLVRWNWIGSLRGLARFLLPLQGLTARMGSDRSAMSVRVFGMVAGIRTERRWTLIAGDGDGPEIPSIAIAPIVRRIAAGLEAYGARDAGEALELADYEPAFRELSISRATEQVALPDPLYRRVMGDDFDRLPDSVRAIHSVLRDGGASGEAEVTGADNAIGALIGKFMRFPSTGTHALHVAFSERDGKERWTRQFGKTAFTSELSEASGMLVERFGPARFYFDLPSDENGLTMVMTRWSIFGIRLPLAIAPQSRAREWEAEGRFHFDVPIALPLIGKIVHYRGHLIRSVRLSQTSLSAL